MTAVWIGVVLVAVVALCFALAYWAPRFIASRADVYDWPEDAPSTGWLEDDWTEVRRPTDTPIFDALDKVGGGYYVGAGLASEAMERSRHEVVTFRVAP